VAFLYQIYLIGSAVMAGLVTRRHVDLLRVIAMACCAIG
jgi:hypothetical protein